MRYKTSMFALGMAFGIYGIAPVVSGFNPFGTPAANAKSGSGHDGSGDRGGNSGPGDNSGYGSGYGGGGTPGQGHTCVMNCDG